MSTYLGVECRNRRNRLLTLLLLADGGAFIRRPGQLSLGPVALNDALGLLLKDRGMTQKALAEKAQIHPQTLNRILRGHVKRPSYEVVLRLVAALNGTTQDLERV